MVMLQFEDICNKYGLKIHHSKWEGEADCCYNNLLICYFSKYLAYITKDFWIASYKSCKVILCKSEYVCYETPEEFELKLQEILKKYKQLEIELKMKDINKDFAND